MAVAYFLPGPLGKFISSNVTWITLTWVRSCCSSPRAVKWWCVNCVFLLWSQTFFLFQVLGSLFYAYYIFVRLCIPQFRNSSQETFSLRGLVLCIFNSILPGKTRIHEWLYLWKRRKGGEMLGMRRIHDSQRSAKEVLWVDFSVMVSKFDTESQRHKIKAWVWI